MIVVRGNKLRFLLKPTVECNYYNFASSFIFCRGERILNISIIAAIKFTRNRPRDDQTIIKLYKIIRSYFSLRRIWRANDECKCKLNGNIKRRISKGGFTKHHSCAQSVIRANYFLLFDDELNVRQRGLVIKEKNNEANG